MEFNPDQLNLEQLDGEDIANMLNKDYYNWETQGREYQVNILHNFYLHGRNKLEPKLKMMKGIIQTHIFQFPRKI